MLRRSVTLRKAMFSGHQGEHLFLSQGDVFNKVDPSRGCESLALGTQRVPAGAGIPVHQHSLFDEAFYVLEGSGTFIFDDTRHAIAEGSVIFVPKGAWHGFETASS